MPRYSVPNKNLKQFATSKSDKKKNVYKIPPEMYKIKDEIVPSPPEESPGSEKIASAFSEEYRSTSSTIYQRNTTEKQVSLPDFKIMKQIGKGSFGTIYLVEKIDSKKIYAMKQLRKDIIIKTDALLCTKLEKEVLKLVDHPFLVGLDYAFQTPTNIYFVMKYYKGGELYKHLQAKKRFPESIARFYGAQVALAIGELHRNNIIYRDMKPENILLDEDGYIALADFGLAKMIEENKAAMTFCGTPEYIAPETIAGRGYNKSIDWWGLGVLLYEMIIGVPPFHCNNQHVLFQYIKDKELRFPDAKHGIKITEEAMDVITKLLCKKPSERLGSKGGVEEILEHPFFKKIDVGKLLAKELKPEYKPRVASIVQSGAISRDIEEIDIKSMSLINKNQVFLSLIIEIIQ